MINWAVQNILTMLLGDLGIAESQLLNYMRPKGGNTLRNHLKYRDSQENRV